MSVVRVTLAPVLVSEAAAEELAEVEVAAAEDKHLPDTKTNQRATQGSPFFVLAQCDSVKNGFFP